ncbi:MAG: hypothetical protein A3E87_10680 [Gammaproteobacteria bacterium RIFCSPHIGHO2_12_FULL_35_23]|nr:MAG: hypothetical protein A3E87_10680 [Gammaproteobacteria bacterium RIFCSPHIGHO2_12_FULL_35_23]
MAQFYLILAAIFWGGNYVVSSVLVFHIPPILLAEIRWLIASIILIMLYHKVVIAEWQAIRVTWPQLTFFAIFGPVLFPLFLYIGLQYTSALNAAILLSSSPALVLIINAILFKDKITKGNIWGVVLSTMGVMYLLLHGHIFDLTTFHIGYGEFFAFLSAVSWAIYCACLRFKAKTYSPQSFITVSSIIGAIILLPCVLLSSKTYTYLPTMHIDYKLLLGIGYLAIFPSVLSYKFWGKGIAIIGATRGEVFTHLVPLSGALLSVIFLHTQLEFYHYIGCTFIILGIILCSHKKFNSIDSIKKSAELIS